jgi:TPR repeat protein
VETPIQEDPLTNSKHAEDDTLSKAGDLFYSRREYGIAQRLYELAAIDNNGFREKGSSYAKLKLGYMYHHFTSTYTVHSMNYYLDAYRNGRSEAGNNIGCIVFNGKFAQKDLELAFQYFLNAATNGNMYAQYNTGRCYKKGFGIQQDLMKALEWYSKSADQGFKLAKDRVSWLNKKGFFIERKGKF